VDRTLIDNRYELQALAGSGGMADVYLAYDNVLDRYVALKLLKDRYARDEEFVERFRREAKSAAALANRHIVPVFDWGEAEGGTNYIVMEYLPDGDLKDWIQSEGRLSSRAAAVVALQVAEALQAAHKRGIIHRDVKPRNILISGSGHVKVADFGIARAVEATTISHPGDILGSAKYMSPEQAAGDQVGPESDLYSLGVVLYEMLTGKVPFDVATPADVSTEHAKGMPRRPSEMNPEVPEALDAIVLKLLARDPADRYGSAAELIEELGRVRDGLPTVVSSADEAPSTALTEVPTLALRPATYSNTTGSAAGGSTGPPRRRALWILVSSAVLIGALGIVSWSLLRDTASVSGTPGGTAGQSSHNAERARAARQEVEVPAVKGLSEQGARKRLDKAGFKVELRSQQSSEKDAGKVLKQSVASGKEVREGSKIVLTVSEGPETATVPDLVGLTYSEAEGQLKQAGFLLGGVKEISSKTVPAGVITRQDPQAGSTLEHGSYVYLTTSIGPPAETT
jgi:serine/threonine protein kinase